MALHCLVHVLNCEVLTGVDTFEEDDDGVCVHALDISTDIHITLR